MQIITIILIAVAVIIAFIILSRLFKKKRWIYQRDVETPKGKSKLYYVQGVDKLFKSLSEAEDYARNTKWK